MKSAILKKFALFTHVFFSESIEGGIKDFYVEHIMICFHERG
jgi:hypothetical protein